MPCCGALAPVSRAAGSSDSSPAPAPVHDTALGNFRGARSVGEAGGRLGELLRRCCSAGSDPSHGPSVCLCCLQNLHARVSDALVWLYALHMASASHTPPEMWPQRVGAEAAASPCACSRCLKPCSWHASGPLGAVGGGSRREGRARADASTWGVVLVGGGKRHPAEHLQEDRCLRLHGCHPFLPSRRR